MNEILSLLSIFVLVLSLTNSFIAILKYKVLNELAKIIGVYIIVSAITELLSWTAASYNINNLFFFHFFAIFEFIILTYFFQGFFKLMKSKVSLVPFFITICTLGLVANSLFFQTIDKFNSYSLTFVSACMITYSLYAFKLMIDGSSEMRKYNDLKWIIISVFIMHTVSVLVVFFSNAISGFSADSQMMVWTFRAVLILISKLILLYVFIQFYKKSRLSNELKGNT